MDLCCEAMADYCTNSHCQSVKDGNRKDIYLPMNILEWTGKSLAETQAMAHHLH